MNNKRLAMVAKERAFEVICVTAANCLEPSIAIAAARAGHVGVLDLEFADAERGAARRALEQLRERAHGRYGAKLAGGDLALTERSGEDLLTGLSVVILTPAAQGVLQRQIEALKVKGAADLRVFIEVVSVEEAALAEAAGADGLIVKGHEAGGRVGEETAFILVQRLALPARLPMYVHGGMGLHTVAAAYAAGAAGIVLDHQLALTRESPLPEAMKAAIARMDGSETVCIGDQLGQAYRILAGPAQRAAAQLTETARALRHTDGPQTVAERWRQTVRSAIDPSRPGASVWLIGQDGAFAAHLAQHYRTVHGVVEALLRAIPANISSVKMLRPLAPDAPLAQSHGTRFPILQGPMTRVSDRAAFAARVAEEGALPFLALALMRAPEVEALLNETRAATGGRPWGVGILGFVPSDRREEQLSVVRRVRPAFALIAGAQPEQALTLEECGIPTYVHVPSPVLLRLFIQSGARRFVFEGRECGGHVGPRSSFVLWSQMIDVLLDAVTPQAAAEYHIVFAGGIHDAMSSAMVAAIAAPLAERGCKLGVLIGTAYTATREAVTSGAILEQFQSAVLACDRTVLVESGPGHTTRCSQSPFVAQFEQERQRLIAAGEAPDRIRDALEELNVGRLRIATKGIKRNSAYAGDGGEAEFVQVDVAEQSAEGLYMLGQVAAMCSGVKSVAELHSDVSEGGTARLQGLMAPPRKPSVAVARPKPSRVAIVGMGCILPKAPDLRTYWQNILDKVDAITEVPEDRWDWRRYYDPDPSAPDKIYSKWGGFLADMPFDPLRYGIPPNSVPSIEPLHLLTLETVRAALEDAGFADGRIADAELRRRTSVILGVGGGTGALGQRYAIRSSLPALMGAPPRELLEVLPEWTEDVFPGVLANVTAGRVANRFDLGGVNFTVDAACGASLAAVTLAVRELEAGTSDMVIVGGADAFQNPFDYMAFSKTHALSPRGKCRTFDASADGIAISEGVAILVLRRLPDAEREGARIYAVIQGAAGSSDGRDKSLTAPRPEGQALALERAYAHAGFSSATVGLIEAHGTGTVAGDRAEVQTLKTVFGSAGAERQSCGIGSVKSMIGHTKCTAGAAGLIKVALALHHKVLPPTLNVERPNIEADFPNSPFYILGQPRPWVAPSTGTLRRAGVSAFGFGGTNFHVAVEEYAEGFAPADREAVRESWPAELLLWGAPSRADLLRQLDQVARILSSPAECPLRDLAYTLWSQFRRENPVRLAIVAASADQALQSIHAFLKVVADESRQIGSAQPPVAILDPRGVYFSEAALDAGARVAFLFPGQGSQYPDMLRDLALHFDEVRETFEQADATLADRLPRRLSSYVFPVTAFSDVEATAQRAALTQTDIAQPAIGAASAALLRLLRAFCLTPEMAAGHSYGEYPALHCAEAFDADTLFALSHTRGHCILQAAEGDLGTMASVAAGADAVTRALAGLPEVQVANQNAPDQTVIAGPRDAIQRAVERLDSAGLTTKAIPVSCGFHSACVAPARDRFADALSRIELRVPSIPVFSNVTASPYPSGPGQMLALLADHLVSQVKFMDQIRAMYAAGARVFVEVGPGAVLTGLVGRILADRPHLAVACDAAGKPGLVQLEQLLAQIAVAGVAVDLERLFAGRRFRRLDLRTLQAGETVRTLSPTTWLVNGASSRPLGAPKRPAYAPAAIGAPAPEPAHAVSNPGNGGEATAASSAPPPGPSGGAPVVRAGSGYPTPSFPSGATPQVMLQFQRLMERFLETEQQVMLAYLGNGARRQPAAGRSTQGDRLAPNEAQKPAAAAITLQVAGAGASPPSARAALSPVPVATPPADRGRVTDVLVGLVSERTGYPADMLDLDLNLEADLGIDSIKRVEILGQFRRQFIPESSEDVRQAMEGLVRAKTLRVIIDGFLALLAARDRQPASRTGGNGSADTAVGEPVSRAAEGQKPAAAAITLQVAGAGASPPSARGALSPVPVATPPADRGRVTDVLVGLVSERTGYPADMLDLDLNLEADLGIDSIKRVEILGQFRRQFIPESSEDVRQAMEGLVRAKTLRVIIDGFLALLAARERQPTGRTRGNGSADAAVDGPVSRAAVGVRRDESEAPRFVLVPVPASVGAATFSPPPGACYLITDDQQGVAERLHKRLAEAGARVVLIRTGPGMERVRDDVFVVDLTDAGAVRAFREAMFGRERVLEGIFHCIPLQPQMAFRDLSLEAWREAIRRDVKTLFNLASVFGRDLSRGSAPCLIAATRLGGAFSADLRDDGLPISNAGVSGLVKTLAKEWSAVHCRVVDFDQASPEVIAEHLLAEAAGPGGEVEVGYRAAQRLVVQAEHRPLRADPGLTSVLDESSVVLVTGGARGITAEVAHDLAARYRPTLVLCGSSPQPVAQEAADTAGIADPRALKAVLIDRVKRRGASATAAAVETCYRELLKEREIRANLATFAACGARVEYHRVDVRDAAALGALIDSVYRDHGRLDGVIHGAGIIEDKLIEDKTADSFDRVVETKTLSAFTLCRKLRSETLRFLVFFTSVAGRFGNRGQSDYAAANEILSKLAAHLDQHWPGRVMAISWGPWNKAGMVSEEVKRQFMELGIQPVDPELGRWAFDQELRLGCKGEAEVVWGNGPWSRDSVRVASGRGTQSPVRLGGRRDAAVVRSGAAAAGAR